jgi:hypothetical protein
VWTVFRGYFFALILETHPVFLRGLSLDFTIL